MPAGTVWLILSATAQNRPSGRLYPGPGQFCRLLFPLPANLCQALRGDYEPDRTRWPASPGRYLERRQPVDRELRPSNQYLPL